MVSIDDIYDQKKDRHVRSYTEYLESLWSWPNPLYGGELIAFHCATFFLNDSKSFTW
jgi:hypothetical protein